MRVLVTGASGFVGRHLVRVLIERGDEVVAWGFSDSQVPDGSTVDLLDSTAIGRHDLRDLDGVIHLAGLAEAWRSFAEPARYVTTNVEMQINLFEELLRQRSFPRVLVVSSGSVYADRAALMTEESPVEPSSPYVVSKLTQELLAGYYAKRGFEAIIARPFNHIGPGQERGYLVPDVCSQIVAVERHGGGDITVGDLTSSRDYTDVRDVAFAYYCLIRNGQPGKTYNVCTGRSLTGDSLVAKLCALSSADIRLVTDPKLARPTDTSDVQASNNLIREHTGWAPTVPLDSTLAETLDYWRARLANELLS
jgi:GDP-4-dehydro-6-deoxy-D-mannose reductase